MNRLKAPLPPRTVAAVLLALGVVLMALGVYVVATGDEEGNMGALPLVLGFALTGYGYSQLVKRR